MLLLIVDDDTSTLEMLTNTLSFKNVGIDQVLTADNAVKAREIFAQNNVDILLADIEMPGESGIELLEWMRKNHYDTQTIFLTNHAEFHYAQQALQLQSTDFIVKLSPPSVIEAALGNAVRKLQMIHEQKQYLTYGQKYEKNRNAMESFFWHELYTGQIPSNDLNISRAIERYDVQIAAKNTYYLVLVSTYRNQESIQRFKPAELFFLLKNIALELFFGTPESPMSVELKDRNQTAFTIIVPRTIVDTSPKSAYNFFQEKCTLLYQRYMELLNIHTNFYVSYARPLKKLCEAGQVLNEMMTNNTFLNPSVIFEQNPSAPPLPGSKPKTESELSVNFELLRSQLIDGQVFQALAYIKTILLPSSGGVNTTVGLPFFFHKFCGMLYSITMEYNIESNIISDQESVHSLYLHATDSVYDMFKWVSVVCNLIVAELRQNSKSETVVGLVKDYIEKHYNEHLNKSVLAEVVYLNPDYLAKLFKRTTSTALNDYINQVRITKSKPLLLNRSISLGDVAQAVGFNYYSYFSTVFKESEGITPKEYRNLHSD